MANLLEKYGIKEVCDVTFYELDSLGAPSAPVLYLDTLKVSTTSQSAESTDATGGKGNGVLITWDYGRDITVDLEDALFSAKSMAMMYGGKLTTHNGTESEVEVLKTFTPDAFTAVSDGWQVTLANQTLTFPTKDLKSKAKFYKYDDNAEVQLVKAPDTLDASAFDFVTVDLSDFATVSGQVIRVDATTFPGTYYVTGDTYARNANSGRDEYYQLIFPKAKITSDDVEITMEADGDASTFKLSLRVLRGKDGQQMKLVKYNIAEGKTEKNKQVSKLVGEYDAAGKHDEYVADPSAGA